MMMHQSQPNDVWALGAAYEPYVGRWSRVVAHEFLAWLAVPPAKQWLDTGCGTGALSQIILDIASPTKVIGIDPSEGYVAFARDQVLDTRVNFRVGDAQALPFESTQFDAVVSGLVLNFVPDPDLAVSEMQRVVRPGGVVAAYVWDYTDQMQLMRYFWNAAVKLDPAAIELDEGQRFQMCKPESLTKLFHTAKLNNIEVCVIDVPTYFRDFDDYWKPFLGGQGPAPTYAMSLSEDRRVALREEIRAKLPIASNGSIQLIARAWAIRGVLPH
jgi:SAM-dependent methyltransferase